MKNLRAVLLLPLILVSVMISCNLKNQETKTDIQATSAKDGLEPGQRSSDPSQTITPSDHTSEIEFTPDTLIGRWLRPDGNYIIQIDRIREDKTLEAQYFNPRPIHIERAEILSAEGLRIFIEFNDIGYEGSSYDLFYDPVNDALTGNYFQATYSQTYQIGFIRMDN